MSDDIDSQLPDLRYVRELAKVFRQYELDEIEIENGHQRILLRRGDAPVVAHVPVAGPAVVPAAMAAPPASGAAPATRSEPAVAASDDADYFTSPFVGTFYFSPRPDSPPFVRPGDRVGPGQTVCIVEAMKLFNEIEAEYAAEIVECLVGNQQPVEFGAKLFKVRRL